MKTKLLNKLVKFFYVITFQLKNIAQPTLFRLGNWQILRLLVLLENGTKSVRLI